MRIGRLFLFALFLSVTCLSIPNQAQNRNNAPHLERHGDATQLMVDGKPFLILSGELTNNAAAILMSTGPDEYYFAGGGMRIDFTPNAPGPQNVGLGDVQQGNFGDGKWVVSRQIAGDDDAQGEILLLRPYTILRVTLYRFP